MFKPWDNWGDMYCVCVPFRRWMDKTKDWSAFKWGMAVGARRTSLCQELQCCWVFHEQQFPMCIKTGPPPKGHAVNLIQTWEALESTSSKAFFKAQIILSSWINILDKLSKNIILNWLNYCRRFLKLELNYICYVQVILWPKRWVKKQRKRPWNQ
jgi:hypothetical protein